MELTVFGIDFFGYLDASVLPQWYLNVDLLVLKRLAEKICMREKWRVPIIDSGWTKQCKVTKEFDLKTRMLFQNVKNINYLVYLLGNSMSFLSHYILHEMMNTLSEECKKYSCSIPLLPSASQTLDSAPDVCVTDSYKVLCEIT